MTAALLLLLAPPAGPTCAEAGRTTMDPRLEYALGVRTRVRVKEPRPPVLVARRER